MSAEYIKEDDPVVQEILKRKREREEGLVVWLIPRASNGP